jgi:hypothetical protein
MPFGKVIKLAIEIGLGVAVGIAMELYHGLAPYLPSICLALLAHYTWEFGHTEFAKIRLGRLKKATGRKPMLGYFVVALVGAALFCFYWWGLNKTLAPRIEAYETEKHPKTREIPLITWDTPAPIKEGTPLSTVQLNAKADERGSFEYIPDVQTRLPVGRHDLLAKFTPDDEAKYEPAEKKVSIIVDPAPPPPPQVVKPSEPPAEGHIPKETPKLVAKIINPQDLAINVKNDSTAVAQNVKWELVTYRLSDGAFFSYATQDMGYIKPHTTSANYSMNLTTLAKAPNGGAELAKGDKIIGSISIDCPECTGETIIVHITYGIDGWFCEVPSGDGRLLAPKNGMPFSNYVAILDSVCPIDKGTKIVTLPQ